MKCTNVRLCFYALYSFSAIAYSWSSHVPVLLWGVNSDKLDVKPVSALETLKAHQFKSYLQKILDVPKTTLIAFVQDRLSLEDLTLYHTSSEKNGPFQNVQAYMELQSSLILPSVEDPSTVLKGMKNRYTVAKLDAEDYRDPRYLLSVIDNSDIVIAHLPYAEIIAERKFVLKKNDELIGKLLKDASGGKKNIVALYTGVLPSWEESQPSNEPHVRVARHILADEPMRNSTEPVIAGNCSLVYVEKVEMNITFEDNSTVNSSISFPSSYIKSFSCESNDTVIINMFFSNMSGINSLGLMLKFTVLSNRWYLNEAELSTSDEVINVTTENIGAPSKFSYSCGKIKLHPLPRNTTSGYLILDGFQIQPFVNGNESLRFSDSFDCIPFFTIPIWMGLFVTLTFTFILAVGIYALFDVKTMDRFDDPKGKTVSVPTTD